MIYPIFSYFLLPRAFTLHMAVQRAEITSKQTDFLKNKGLNSAFLRRCSGTPLGGACLTLFISQKVLRYAPWGRDPAVLLTSVGADRPSGQSAPLPSASALGRARVIQTWPARDFSCSWFLFRGELASASSSSGRFRVRRPSHPLGWPRASFLLVLFSWGANFR